MEVRFNVADRRERGRNALAGRGRAGSGASRQQSGLDRRLLKTRVFQILQLVAVTVGFVGMIWGTPIVFGWLDRPVARVKVQGPFVYLNEQRVQEEVRPYLKQRFFSLDLVTLQSTLQDMPWVSQVRVRKVWPDQLEIELQEENPVARWRDDELLNGDGVSFEPGKGLGFADLPRLSGPEGREQDVMQQYVTLGQQLRPQGLAIEELALTDTGSWWLQVDGVKVWIGKQSVLERMQRFIGLYHSALQSRWGQVGTVDLRYRDGVAVVWED